MPPEGQQDPDELERLRADNAALRQALKEQWEANHYDRCGEVWPHPPGDECMWDPPAVLNLRQDLPG